MSESIKIKLPLIGIDKINNETEFFNELFMEYNKKDGNQKIKDRENEIGKYLKFTQRLERILKLMFPEATCIPDILRSIGLSHLRSEKQEPLPLFGYHLDGLIQIAKGKKEQWASAWANLMYDLGEFQLDEIFFDKNENDNKENDIKENVNSNNNIRHINIDDIIPHIYKFDRNWYVWWANIPEAGDTIRNIWDRITGEDVQIISVDDDRNFAKLFFGNDCDIDDKSNVLLCIDLENKKKLNPKNLDKDLIWINPGTSYKDKEILGQINHIVRNSQKNLLVFVIDLIFKESQESNVIKGDKLIKNLRRIKGNALIVGITGGTSPFIINSAEKAGADIVVFKKRGDDPENIAGHSSGGNSIGVFDLLWAVSWNVSVWRLLEAYKKDYIDNKVNNFQNIAGGFFPSIENASPFWKEYLDKWKTDINDEKIKRLLP